MKIPNIKLHPEQTYYTTEKGKNVLRLAKESDSKSKEDRTKSVEEE